MKKSCKTCKHTPNPGCARIVGLCINHDEWKPKEPDVHTAREAIDRAFTEFTDKLKGCDPETPLSYTQKKSPKYVTR